MGYREFDAEIHYCLHLAPWLGLLTDMVGERENYRYDRMQGLVIVLIGAGYALWLGFLYVHSGVIKSLSMGGFVESPSLTPLSLPLP